MLSHGYLPELFMETLIVPLVKDKKDSITDKSNYRPIAITNTMSKVLENVILSMYKDYFHTTDNQFGFKKNSSTESCIFAFKEVVDYYNNLSSPV